LGIWIGFKPHYYKDTTFELGNGTNLHLRIIGQTKELVQKLIAKIKELVDRIVTNGAELTDERWAQVTAAAIVNEAFTNLQHEMRLSAKELRAKLQVEMGAVQMADRPNDSFQLCASAGLYMCE
jgi:hypothetical protein